MRTVKGFAHHKSKSMQNKDVEFYEHGVFAKRDDMERADLYAKPGTSAAERQTDPWGVSVPTSRFRSRRP